MIRSISFLAVCLLLAACSTFDDSDQSAAMLDAFDTADRSDVTLEARASGLVLTNWPSQEDPGPPFYTRIEPIPPYVYHDGAYAAVVFYRGPEGIRSDFNLLALFDPGPSFGVNPNMMGTNLWHGAVANGSPKVANSRGLGAVPVWFVPAEPLLAFISAQGEDPVLTLPDLAGMAGLIKGLATHFNEVNHPHPLPPDMVGGHPQPKLSLTARGALEDGRRFDLNLRGQETAAGWQRSTDIRFR
jgi:hypothetical protein